MQERDLLAIQQASAAFHDPRGRGYRARAIDDPFVLGIPPDDIVRRGQEWWQIRQGRGARPLLGRQKDRPRFGIGIEPCERPMGDDQIGFPRRQQAQRMAAGNRAAIGDAALGPQAIGIGAALAVLLTSFVVYSHVSDREREIAMMKALGVRDRAIYGAMLVQALFIGLTAFVLAIGVIVLAIPLTDQLMPKVSLGITVGALVRTGAVAVVTSLIAAAIPVRRVLSVDPVSAFQQ